MLASVAVPTSRPSPIAIVPALILIAIATWETCATPRDAASTPRDESWDTAEKVVRAGHQPGDLIVFAPDWIDPVGRLHFGDLIPVDMAARMDASVDRTGCSPPGEEVAAMATAGRRKTAKSPATAAARRLR